MTKVIPIIVICSVGIALALGYIAFVAVKAISAKRGSKRARNEFEIEEDALTIKLRKRKKK